MSARTRIELARFGEDVAAAFLEARGAKVIERNVRVGRDEIDLLVRLSGRLVAVEVKTRRPGLDVDPAAGFTPDKARRTRRAARRIEGRVDRIDLVGVTVGRPGVTVRWIPGAG